MSHLPAHMMEQTSSPQKHDNLWEKQQQKAFTAWCNSQLRTKDKELKVADVEKDLSDGHMLTALMEVVANTTLPKCVKGKMRIHKIQNLNNVMNFIQSKGVKLIGIGAEEIVDENLKLILGMLWTIILRFDIQDISIEQTSAKDALMLWCQRKTASYNNVNVKNFHMSWKDGLAFCALIHKHRPDLIDYASLRKDQPVENCRLAMKVAEESLDMMAMIDPEDFGTGMKPDERAVMTQVAAFYKVFAGYNKGEIAASKIATVLRVNQEHDRLQTEFETMATTLLEWVPQNQAALDERVPLVTVDDCMAIREKFNGFRTQEYPGKLNEKGRLEAFYSSLQTKLSLNKRSPYVPPEGMMIEQIQGAWQALDDSDVSNKKWVLQSLRDNKACTAKEAVFMNKTKLHQEWAAGKAEALQVQDFEGADLGTLNALTKKHESFRSDLHAHETRVADIGLLANELDDLQFVRAMDINNVYATIYGDWQNLIELTAARTQNISDALENREALEALWVDVATNASPLHAFLDEMKSKLLEPLNIDTQSDVNNARAVVTEVEENMKAFAADYGEYQKIVEQALSISSSANPFELYTPAMIQGLFDEVATLIPSRTETINAEEGNQSSKEDLRKEWAATASDVSNTWTNKTASIKTMSDIDAGGSLEERVAQADALLAEVTDYHTNTYVGLEELNKRMEDAVILDNDYSNITMEILRSKFYTVSMEVQSLKTDLENQILLRDGNNISEEQMQEFNDSFKHFDKDKSGALSELEFRACLISLGVPDIPTVPTPGEDGEFDRIMQRVDPNGDSKISLNEFVSFMSEERADVQEKDDFLEQLKVLAQNQDYIMPSQLGELPDDLRDYCLSSMPAYSGGPDGALDYQSFADVCYGDADV
eukprot:m.112562 g.112562  ORF g.112562 m.112562 type:complete len:883 (-) comp28199_c0_seq1:135-2783(-)